MSQFTYTTPADIHDFPVGSPQDLALRAQWNTNLTGFTAQAILGDPWNLLYSANQTSYFDTAAVTIPSGTPAVIINWNVFPNRLAQYLGTDASPANPYNYSELQLLALADQVGSSAVSVPAFQQIPTNLCPQADWSGPQHTYGPYGPRGWLDEYCEWSVARDPATGKIRRIDFTCENPEYWNTLWMIDPNRVVELYNSTLNWDVPPGYGITITLDDLTLKDPVTGQTVIDPSTGRPAYNPLNKYNSGPISTRPVYPATNPLSYSGGAMHLTSTPNTLQTEMQLAGGATVLRLCGNSNTQQLICCAQYGQAYRNSDPHIGQVVNQAVSTSAVAALANPSGLYIQVPDLSGFSLPPDPKLPKGASVQDCWQIVRGSQTLIDPITGLPYGLTKNANGQLVGQGGNFVLHAVFQIPSAWIAAGVKFTVGDIRDPFGNPIQWGGQIAQQMDMGLWARAVAAQVAPLPNPCVIPPPAGVSAPADAPSAPNYAQPLQLFHQAVWQALYKTSVPNPMNSPISLASNSTLIAPLVARGAQNVPLVLVCTATLNPLPDVSFGTGVTVSTVQSLGDVSYAIPGNSYPSSNQALLVTVSVAADAALGLHGCTLTNSGDPTLPAMPGLLNVVASLS